MTNQNITTSDLIVILESYRKLDDDLRYEADKIFNETKDVKKVDEFCKSLVLQKAAKKALSESMINKRFAMRTFDNFKPYNTPTNTALNACKEYAGSFKPDVYKNVILAGEGCVGTGKTHLAGAIAIHVMKEKAIPAKFMNVTEMFSSIIKDFKNIDSPIIETLRKTPLLVLDDLGKEKVSEWTEQVVYSIINYRYENMLSTIITVEKNYEFLANLYQKNGKAIISRFLEECLLIRLDGQDYRRMKGNR